MNKIKIGNGFDVHRVSESRPLILGGELIENAKGLDGHSDADVLTHAIMDSLLGAAGLRDIGHYFPNTDQQYANIKSLLLLEKVKNIIKGEGYSIGNIDSVVIAEKPYISPYIANMKKNISRVLEIEETDINIKATTMERIGSIGREEGIMAICVALLVKNQTEGGLYD